jgi:ATP-dependent Lhr-like helicase
VLSRVSPLAVPVLLEIGRERVAAGVTEEQLLLEAEVLVAEAMNPNEPPAPRRAKGKSAVPGQAVLAGIR